MGGVVFINYRGVDSRSYGALLYTDLVRRFGEDLVFLDAESIPAGEDYVQELLTQVRSARVVLAVIGSDWLVATDIEGQRAIDDPDDWVRRELVEAFTAGVRVIPVLTDGAELPDVADLPHDIAALSRCQARRLRRRESIRDLDRLAADLTALDPVLASAGQFIAEDKRPRSVLNSVDGGASGLLVQAGSISGGLQLHLHHSGPGADVDRRRQVRKLPVDTGVFVGRDSELARLDEATGEADRVVVVAVQGLGGVGKSTLAARFAHLNAEKYSPVWWMTADSTSAVDTGLADFATALAPEVSGLPAEQRTERAVGWLANNTGWLLILDNLTTPADAQPLLERVHTGTILITSRYRSGWRNITTLSLGVLEPDEAIDLLGRTVRAEWAEADLDNADQLCGELGWLPLAIEQAGAYIAHTRITPTRYLELLARFPARMFTATAEGGDAQRTMARVWHVTLDRITDTPLAGRLLRELAWYAPDNISRALLEHPRREPEVAEALGRLAAYNMITLTADFISVHRLVQAVTRTPAPDDAHRRSSDITEARDNTAATLADVVEGAQSQLPANWPRYETVAPHALALFARTTPDTDTELLCSLAHSVGTYLLDQGRHSEAINLFDRAATGYRRLHGPFHPGTLTSRNSLAVAYESMGDLKRAIPLFVANLTDRERALGASHPATLKSRNNLAAGYEAAGDLTHAVPLLETNLDAYERLLGPDHPDTLTARTNLASGYSAAGDPTRAIPLLEVNLAACGRVLGPDHPHTLITRSNLASAYGTAGNLGQAVPRYEETLAEFERVLGADHPNTLTSRRNLASIYQAAGQLQRAASLFEASLVDSERVLGTDHPETLRSRIRLADTYRRAGNLRRAVSLFESTLADHERVLGTDHPDTLASRSRLASAYQEAGDLGRAGPLLGATLADYERVLGTDHLDTLGLRSKLAFAYQAAGDLGRAIPLFEDVLAGYEQVLSVDHPAILSSRNNLAAAYQAAGDLDRAIPLFKMNLADRERVLGADHSDTLRSLNDLASAYEAAGDLRRAISLHEAAHAAYERVLGLNHPDTLSSRHNLASAYQAAEDLKRAVPLFEANLAACERVLDADHPHIPLARNSLAIAYVVAGDPERAIPLYEAILADYERVLGLDHHHSLLARNNLADVHRVAGSPGRAIPLYEANLASCGRVLGPDHFNTLSSRNSLASACKEVGDLQRAASLFETNLAACIRALGVDHPRTLDARNELAATHQAAGNLEQAITLYEANLIESERLLGSDHLTTTAIRSSLRAIHES